VRRARRRLLPRPEPVAPPRGSLDVARLVGVLRAGGYEGSLAVEYEGEDALPALAELARACREAGVADG
jgi:hypothetical protein